MDGQFALEVTGVVLGGVNLAVLLNLVLNHLRHIEDKLDEHLRDHRIRAETLADRKENPE